MPVYEYRCASCSHHYEKREGFDAPSLQRCPECGARKARRVLQAPPVVFKGSGFYSTDSRKSGAAADGASDGAKPSDGDAAPKKTDDKPLAEATA